MLRPYTACWLSLFWLGVVLAPVVAEEPKAEDKVIGTWRLQSTTVNGKELKVELGGETIKFGATVTLIDEDTRAKKIYQIVGESEADVKSGKISITSPIARALIGKKAGDAVEVNAPGGGKSYEILKIAFL